MPNDKGSRFDLHPAAAKSIDDGGVSLLGSVVELTLKPRDKPSFPSERPISATITDSDLLEVPFVWTQDEAGVHVFAFILSENAIFGDYALEWTNSACYGLCMLKNIRDVSRYLDDEKAAGELIEKLRWPDGVVTCPLCEGLGKDGKAKRVYECTAPNAERKQWKCGACRKKFSVTSRSIFEGSHIRLGHWIYAIYKMCTSKKGVSANQLKRELGIHYRSAWFLCHRVREAMALEPMASMLGAGGGIVELDKTYVGGKARNNLHRDKGPNATKKAAVMTLIDRDGDVRSVHVPSVKKGTLQAWPAPIKWSGLNVSVLSA